MVGIVKREKTLLMNTCIAASGRQKHGKALRKRIAQGTRAAADNLLLKRERTCQKVSHGGLSPDTPIDSPLPDRPSRPAAPITNEAGNAVDMAKNPRSSEHGRSMHARRTPHFVHACAPSNASSPSSFLGRPVIHFSGLGL